MTPFASTDAFFGQLDGLPGVDAAARAEAEARNGQLTKPPGALGRLEDLALWYAGWRGDARPVLSQPQVIVFAGNHGIAAQGVSAFPAEVTVQMVANFRAGGAAINQIAREAGARFSVVELELERPTGDFSAGPAMSDEECAAALSIGWEAVEAGSDLLVVGEMGIANTTAAAALALALYGGAARDWAGRGTGLDDAGLAHKCAVIDRAAALHGDLGPAEALRTYGGREMAAMAGAIARARALRIPVVLDGFITTASAAVLECAQAGALDHCAAGHRSPEPGHSALLERLGKVPLLDLGMRLGEASGAALAIPVVRAALACHSGMATFAEAGVSEA